MPSNPLANPDTASLPVQAPPVSDIPHVISTPDPVASAAYAALARELAALRGDTAALLTAVYRLEETGRLTAERVSTLGNGMHTVLSRLEHVEASRQQAQRQPSSVWNPAEVETAYREALTAHGIHGADAAGMPDLKGKLTFTALYQVMACEGPTGPSTSSQTAVQGNGREAYASFSDARRLWALKYQELKPAHPADAAVIAKRAVLEWLALPSGRQSDGCISRYRLIAHGGLDFAYLLTLVPDNHADPEGHKAKADALLLRVRAVVDPGAAVTKLA